MCINVSICDAADEKTKHFLKAIQVLSSCHAVDAHFTESTEITG